MSKNEIVFGLIGCGRIAERHIEAINQTNKANIAAVCDSDKIRVKEKAELASAASYTDYHQMLKEHPEIDIIILLTPSGMHYEQAKDIMQNHHKHILLEKPMVMTMQQGQALNSIAHQSHCQIFPVYQHRFNQAVQRVKKAIANNDELGAVRVGTVRVRWCRPQRYYDQSPWRGTWAMDGGALTNQGIHYIDLLRYLCGDVKRVHAKLSTLGADIEVEDTGVAILEFNSGALGVLEIMTSARPDDFEASISCVCEKGLAVISGSATNELKTFSPDSSQEKECSELFQTPYGNGHNVIIQGIVNCLLDNSQPAIEFNDGLESIQLLHALYLSDEINGWVDVQGAISQRLGQPNKTDTNVELI